MELLPENKVAVTIFYMVRGQCETRWNGEKDIEIDLNHVALWKAIEKFPGGVQNEWGCFTKIIHAWHIAQQRKRDSEG